MRICAGVDSTPVSFIDRRETWWLDMDNRFDGDAVNCSVILDRYMADKSFALDHRFNVFSLDTPLKISGNTKLPKPVVSTMSAWEYSSRKKLEAYA